jgi:hypothetical protein
VIKETREVRGFSRVAVGNQGDLFIRMGDKEALVIEAQKNLIDLIETRVEGKTLEITTRPRTQIRSRKPIRYYLTAKHLEGLIVFSSGDIEAPDMEADKFSVIISSSGDVKIEKLYARVLEVRISSSGDLIIDGGEAKEQDIRISSSGDYKGRGLVSREADVSLSSSGDLYVRGNPNIDAHTTSSGRIITEG